MNDCCVLAIANIADPYVGQFRRCAQGHGVLYTERRGWIVVGEDAPQAPDGRFNSTMAAVRAGITYRQLNTWCANGWINGQPKELGSGERRRFTDSQVYRLRQLAAAAEVKKMPIPELANYLSLIARRHELRSVEDVRPGQGSLL